MNIGTNASVRTSNGLDGVGRSVVHSDEMGVVLSEVDVALIVYSETVWCIGSCIPWTAVDWSLVGSPDNRGDDTARRNFANTAVVVISNIYVVRRVNGNVVDSVEKGICACAFLAACSVGLRAGESRDLASDSILLSDSVVVELKEKQVALGVRHSAGGIVEILRS